tara:strand:+ start:920 stop:1504 length:585 start_codon:yes stop_codon:yes gene_type:complete
MPVAIKIKRFTTASDVPTTSELVDGEIAVNVADKKIYVRDGSSIVEVANLSSSGSVDLSAVAQNIIPDANGTRNLGSATKRFADLFLSGDTINLGGALISSDGTGTVSVSATGVTLPVESKDEDGNKLAVQGSSGRQVIRKVPFFTAAGGLSTVNKNFEFNATIDNRTAFGDAHTFTLSDGSNLTDTDPTLFQF